MKPYIKLLALFAVAVGISACGIKGDVKPPAAKTASSTSFTVR